MINPSEQLAVAGAAIYAILVIPSIYVLFKHGWQGLNGWIFLVGFCMLRIIGCTLQISDDKKGSVSTTPAIISGVGLSPLVLAFIGILYESNHYMQGQKSFLLRWPPTIALHFQVGAAVALVVVGYTSNSKSGPTLAKVGYILFVLLFVFIAAFASLSWKYSHTNIDSKRLLIAVTVALPFLAIRVLYSCISAFDTSISPFTGPIVYRVVLAVLMEFICAIVFAVFGVFSRNIRLEQPRIKSNGPRINHKSGAV